MASHSIGTVGEFPQGEGKLVTVKGIPIAVFHIDGQFYGIADNCPHKNLPIHLAGRKRYLSTDIDEGTIDLNTRGRVNSEKKTVHCPWHHMEWDLETGENVRPVSYNPIPTFEVSVDGDEVKVDL